MTNLDDYRAVSRPGSNRPLEHGDLLGVPAPPLPVLTDGWSARAVDPDTFDLQLVHGWMQSPHVAAFWQQAWSRELWDAELRRQLAGVHSLPCLVGRDSTPMLYLEIYRAARDQVARCYRALPHDIGVHVAVGDLALTDRGLVRAVLPVLTAALFEADPECTRVLLEPDVRNKRAIASFQAGGFDPVGEILLPGKVALLMIHSR
ncbi:GNAT family N-acetyltransferase [Umezawaea sp. Da 62-37]|uniref:GNAT family N-acetyltransferase n=1 Tax=Umezawaea sp. Da 62-37 TaxID=3075927 RepID=UPI0028F71413|nr:GNAT family N-acetyltransferase [Umezawaea sp. Da 62-37]WNV84167.1 GNAT family N-acetyltransferase [Umezawaea sp. Da 62-37]